MNISQAAGHTGLSAKTIRYYESIGLINQPPRADNGYRRYHEGIIRQLQFIKGARHAGFTLDECRILMDLHQNEQRTSAQVKQIALEKIDELKARMKALQQTLNTLEQLAASCNGDDNPDCPILNSFEQCDHCDGE